MSRTAQLLTGCSKLRVRRASAAERVYLIVGYLLHAYTVCTVPGSLDNDAFDCQHLSIEPADSLRNRCRHSNLLSPEIQDTHLEYT